MLARNRVVSLAASRVAFGSTILSLASSLASGALLVESSGALAGFVAANTGSLLAWTGTAWDETARAQNLLLNNVVGGRFSNTTPADVVNTVQYGPIVATGGTAWKSDPTAASQTQRWGIQCRPATGAASTTSTLHFLWENNGAAWASKANLASTAAFTATGGVGTNADAGSWLSGSYLRVGANLILYPNVDRNFGIGAFESIGSDAAARPMIVCHVGPRTDGAGNIVHGFIASNSTGLWTNGSTMRLLTLGVAKTSATYTYLERLAAMIDGSLWQSGLLVNAAGEPIANAGGLWNRPIVEVTTLAASSYTDTTIVIPAGACLLGVSWYVRTGTTTAVTFDLGVAGDTTRFATGVSLAATTAGAITLVPVRYTGATAIRITPNATPGDANGRIVICAHYYLMTAAAA